MPGMIGYSILNSYRVRRNIRQVRYPRSSIKQILMPNPIIWRSNTCVQCSVVGVAITDNKFRRITNNSVAVANNNGFLVWENIDRYSGFFKSKCLHSYPLIISLVAEIAVPAKTEGLPGVVDSVPTNCT